MAITSTTQIAGPVNRQFQEILLRNAVSYCPYFFGTVPGEVQAHAGTFTALWRRIEKLTPTTTPLAELTGAVAFPTRTGSTPSVTDVTATAQKYGDFIFLNEEVDLINYQPGQQDKLAENLGQAAGESLNRLQRNVAEDNLTALFTGTATTATGITGAGSSSNFPARGDFQNIVNILARNNARKFKPQTTGSQNIGTSPIRTSFVGVAHPDIVAHLRTLGSWLQVEQYAGQTETWSEEVGTVDGIRFIETSESSIDTTTGVAATGSSTSFGRSTATRYDVYSTVIYGQDALGSLGLGAEHVKDTYYSNDKLPAVIVVNTKRGSAGSADPLSELSTIGYKTWHGGVVLNGTWGRVLKSPAPVLDSNE